MRSTRPVALLAVAAALLLAGCTPIVTVEPADDAENPLCAAMNVRLPDSVQGLERRETNGQGTGAWGDPASVLLACGVPVPGPSTARCVDVDGVHWIIDDSQDPIVTFTTYGRDPATRVVIDSDAAATGPALYDLANAVAFTQKVGECTDLEGEL